MISVDVPEPLGNESYLGPFSLTQIIRIMFYSLPIIILIIYISVFLIILLILPVILVWKKYNNTDLDIFFIKAIIWKILPKRKERSDIIEFINFKTLSRNSLVWEYFDGYMCAIETSGLSLEFMDESSKESIYSQYCSILNSIDFPISIYIYSYKDNYEIKLNNENAYLKRVKEAQEKLLKYYNNKISKKKFIIVLDLKYSENKYKIDLKRASEILNERANLIMNSLESINLRTRRLKFHEYGELYSFIW
ncbi:MAG: hypothetical protein ACP5F1_00555 [Thermoplasmata archaeon]|nr:hypothetical protein [Thermoplasmata archaeon]